MPARFRDIVRALRKLGVTVAEPRRGSHWKLVDASGKSTVISVHGGMKSEISDIYISVICRTFGLEEGAFRGML